MSEYNPCTGTFVERPAKYKILKISKGLLFGVLFNTPLQMVSTGISGNIMLRAVSNDMEAGTEIVDMAIEELDILLKLWNDNWPEVEKGKKIPRVDCMFTAKDIILAPTEYWEPEGGIRYQARDLEGKRVNFREFL